MIITNNMYNLINLDGAVIYSPTKKQLKKERYQRDSKIFENRRNWTTSISLIAATALTSALIPTIYVA